MEQIEIMDGIQITNDYCIYLEEQGIVIIADLHLGYEAVIRLEGVMIPKYQKDIIVSRLEKIIEKYKPNKIIVNGDFKHNFSKNLKQEWREVKELLSFISSKTDVLLIRGNHDNFLTTIASHCNVPIKWKETIDDMVISHGHLECQTSKFLIIAHEHPALHLRDEIGVMIKLPCFLVSKSIVVLPAFSPLATGTDVISAERSDYLSPLIQKTDIDSFRIFAVSEIGLLDFATIRELKKLES